MNINYSYLTTTNEEKGNYNSKRIYSANGILRYFFPRICAVSNRTKMQLNGMLLIETEFCKIIVPL